MRSRFRSGSARLVGALFGGLGLIGLLIAIALMANMAAEQADTSIKTRQQAEEDIEQIQQQLDTKGRETERMMSDFERRPRDDDTTTAPNEENQEQ
ncbi:MAG: hypothetical protein ACOC9S_01105 [Planctomycetota bacterium]